MNKPDKIVLIFLFIFIFAISISIFIINQNPIEDKTNFDNTSRLIKINDITISANVADTPEKRERGLMFVNELEEYSGMLFVFEYEDYYSFWIKNTLIPLEIIFINSEMKIVDIQEMEPCKSNEIQCKIYTSKQKIRYALELNSNFSIKNNINIGDKVLIN